MSANSLRLFSKRVFILSNIIIAIAFLIGCYGNRLNTSTFWFAGFFTLASFYFFLLLLMFIIFWLLTKAKFVWISTLAILLAWVPLKNLVQLRFPAEFSMQKQPDNLRIMCWNVEHFDILEHKTHPEVKQEMIDNVNNYQPDVACFQEMVASDSFPAAINYIPDFMKQLKMKDCHFSYNRKLDFDSRHHFGIITFSKFPIIHKQTISYPPHDYNSIFQFSDIVKGKDTFRVFNIHLQSLKFSDKNLKYIEEPSLKGETDLKNSKNILAKFKTGFIKRQIQSDHIKAAIDKSPYPVIVCGDFNDVPNSYAYNRIGDGLKNAFAEKGSGIGRTFFGISPTLRIDNLFADKRFVIEQYNRIKKKMSDHFPLIVDLHFKKQ